MFFLLIGRLGWGMSMLFLLILGDRDDVSCLVVLGMFLSAVFGGRKHQKRYLLAKSSC